MRFLILILLMQPIFIGCNVEQSPKRNAEKIETSMYTSSNDNTSSKKKIDDTTDDSGTTSEVLKDKKTIQQEVLVDRTMREMSKFNLTCEQLKKAIGENIETLKKDNLNNKALLFFSELNNDPFHKDCKSQNEYLNAYMKSVDVLESIMGVEDEDDDF